MCKNSYETIENFSMVPHIASQWDKFRNLERFEFEGFVEEDSLQELLNALGEYPKLMRIRLI